MNRNLFYFPSGPYTSNSFTVPTKTFPAAIVGTVNFRAKPAVSRDPACVLSYSSLETFEVS